MPNPTMLARPRGRPSRHAKYEALLANLPASMKKRPLYCDQVGLFRGTRGVTVWLKLRLQNGTSRELKLGSLSSWSWEQLEAKRIELQGRADRGQPLTPEAPVSFSSHAKDWLDRKRFTAKAPDILAGHVRKHLQSTFGPKELTAITVTDVNRWIATQRQFLKPATVQRQFATLNAILNDAVRAGHLDKNPAANADAIRGAEPRSRVLGMPELHSVIGAALKLEADEAKDAVRKPNQIRGLLSDFILWAVHSGMRRQEILNLRWSNVVRLQGSRTLVEIPTSKSGKSRHVTCTTAMDEILDRLRGRNRPPGDDRIFPVSLTTIKRKLTKLWGACGVPDVRLHDLRRTHASTLIRAGVDPRTVAGRLGHRDLSMLMKHYAIYYGDGDASDKAQEMFTSLQ